MSEKDQSEVIVGRVDAILAVIDGMLELKAPGDVNEVATTALERINGLQSAILDQHPVRAMTGMATLELIFERHLSG